MQKITYCLLIPNIDTLRCWLMIVRECVFLCKNLTSLLEALINFLMRVIKKFHLVSGMPLRSLLSFPLTKLNYQLCNYNEQRYVFRKNSREIFGCKNKLS